ncbi:probable phytol kinase 2, chloroplastic isoform X2 [Phalaenopsis equestris]|uniref:probable phytol kinase 2, chloroplastic isoform X2 n=1 Tax=Phalaenopsis equestris TaxID=78828 RepID=UPI0009E65B24|nr:probable phytol kinase 2, chloroplastic isoform X2 [Phalaenopsis equestris]
MSPESGTLVHDIFSAGLTLGVVLGLLIFWGEIAKRSFFEQTTIRKLVHISVGLVFMFCWPLFSPSPLAPFLAAVAPGINIIRMLLLGLGIWKNEAVVKSMTRKGDYRELLRGPLCYACSLTLSTTIFWRTSPIAIAAICNLCAGDGSISMAIAGFMASIGFMHYFASFGFVEESWSMFWRFMLVSLAAAIVESLPIHSELDDNLTVSLTSLLVGAVVF